MIPATAARVYETETEIPTYHLREDPSPPLFAASDPWVYPYPKQDEIVRPRDEAQVYRAVVLENPYLKVTVLPQLGGRVYSAYDKAAGRDIFYKVDVIKPALIGLRGAWISGGIEFNFIKGHHVMTASPVDYMTRENDDGSVSVTVGHMERRSRARWNVTLTVHPDRASLQVDLKLYNRYRYPLDFYEWSNSSVVAREDLRLVYPIDYAISSSRRLYRFPIQGGADLSRWTTIPIAHDLFAIGSDKDFFGAYYDDADVGMVHYANHYQAPGKKMFTWGTDDAGRIWDHILADGDVPYAEPQSGSVVDQSTFLFLQPHQVVEWREFWWGVRGMKGFVEVNAEAALNLAPIGQDRTLLAVNTTRPVEGARLRLIVNGHAAHECSIDVGPAQPYAAEIAVPHDLWRHADTQLVLSDALGHELIRYQKPQPNMFAKVALPKPFVPEIDGQSSAEALVIAAREAEKRRNYDKAESLYQRALELDPGHSRACAGLGALHGRQGLYRHAYEELSRAAQRNPDLGEAHYHLGIVCRELGDRAAAREHFWAVRLDPAHNAQGFYFLAEMALADGELEKAVTLLHRSLALNTRHVKGHGLLATTLHKLGRRDDARALLDRVLTELDPTDVQAQAERWLLDRSDEQENRLQSRIGDDVQVLLELACDYVGVGLWQDAIDVLMLWLGSRKTGGVPAMVHYYLAYCHDKLGDAGSARDLYAQGSQMDPGRIFPHRLEELGILSRALEIIPHDAHALTSKGTLLYALRRKEEAMEAWLGALDLNPDAVTHRNVGKSLWKDKGALAMAKNHYEKAIALNGHDHRLYVDLCDILVEMDAPAENRVALLQKAPAHGRVQLRLAAALVQLARWDDAVDVLTAMQYDPYEGERGTRPTYYAAYVGRGLMRYEQGDLEGALNDLEAALTYPRNIGVGRSHYAQDSQASYWAGVVAAERGEADKARRHWENGATVRPHYQEEPSSPLAGYQPEARHYKSLCLQKLGRAKEAAQLF